MMTLALVQALGVGTSAPGRAQAPDPFTVRGVAVDQTAQTALQAREAAISEGARFALHRLLERLTPASEYRRLPTPGAARVADMVQNYEIENERSSAVRYLGSLTFRFKADEVRQLLRVARIPFAETYARPLLVVPVLMTDRGELLWEPTNPWRAAWAQVPMADALASLVVAPGDTADQGLTDAEAAAVGNGERVLELARKYGAAGAIIAVATLGAAPAGWPVLEVALTRIDAADEGPELLPEIFEGRSVETPEQLMARAARSIASAIEERWKAGQLIQFGRQARLVASVPVAGLADWIQIRQRLTETAIIQRTEILVLGRTEAVVEIVYMGDETQLRQALAQRDLVLAPDAQRWRLSLSRP